jgi:2,3-bisphosphoglycerate-independent phosphoglycerate mutase
MRRRPVLLILFDGFGLNPNRVNNGWALARTPHLDYYFANHPHTALQASGLAVGLPDGQFGNSEVGHMTLGAGRVLEQDLLRIAIAIRNGSVAQNPTWQEMLTRGRRLHLVGLVSDGGVHSHIEHLIGLLGLLAESEVEPVVHLVTDGRDTPPHSALQFLQRVEDTLSLLGRGFVGTVMGRYCAMDRARHWDRTEKAWAAMVLGRGLSAPTAYRAIEDAYARGEGDEFIVPTVVGDPAVSRIAADEPVLFFNFRSDRARQLAAAIGSDGFSEFDRRGASRRPVYCMTEYDPRLGCPVLFRPQFPARVLAEVLSDAGLRQFHCAETEKYPHVTYFFNGGREEPFPGEDRAIVPSPNVATYDERPEMSAAGVADRTIAAIVGGQYDFVLVNFANGDMVGHTATRHAVVRAVETLDLQGHRVIQAALHRGFTVLLTADHGNCDELVDPQTGEPHTQHTPYPVPFLLLGEPGVTLGVGRGLADVAPTILDLLDLPQPREMTGRSIILKGGLVF